MGDRHRDTEAARATAQVDGHAVTAIRVVEQRVGRAEHHSSLLRLARLTVPAQVQPADRHTINLPLAAVLKREAERQLDATGLEDADEPRPLGEHLVGVFAAQHDHDGEHTRQQAEAGVSVAVLVRATLGMALQGRMAQVSDLQNGDAAAGQVVFRATHDGVNLNGHARPPIRLICKRRSWANVRSF